MDVLTKEQRSFNMSRIGAKNTKPEMILRRKLWNRGLRYRLHYKLPGKPDIVFTKNKIAVFVDGCFWHGCPEHSVKVKTNAAFWEKKIGENMERDRKNLSTLQSLGWKVFRFWEHEIKRSVDDVANKIFQVVKEDLIHREL